MNVFASQASEEHGTRCPWVSRYSATLCSSSWHFRPLRSDDCFSPLASRNVWTPLETQDTQSTFLGNIALKFRRWRLRWQMRGDTQDQETWPLKEHLGKNRCPGNREGGVLPVREGRSSGRGGFRFDGAWSSCHLGDPLKSKGYKITNAKVCTGPWGVLQV